MSAPSVPTLRATLRQRIQDHKDLATEVKEKDAILEDIDSDRTPLSNLDNLRPELNDEANWLTWDGTRLGNEIARVNELIQAARARLELLNDKIGDARRTKEGSDAED